MYRLRTISGSVAVGVFVVGVLAGCSGGGVTTPTATATRTVTAAPTSTSSAVPTDAPSATPSSGTRPDGDAPSSSGTGAAAPARCVTGDLAGSVQAGSGGAAGSVYVHLVLRNTGSGRCTLQGWPGVSFVGDTNGTQLGNAAAEDRTAAHPTVTLASGQEAVAPLRITRAGNYPAATCDPTSPDGLRVYPPGSRTSLFVPVTQYTACRSTGVTILSVQALVPEGQAAD